MELLDTLPKIKENISLAKYTTFRVGGKARYFFIAETKKDLIAAVKTARDLKIPFFILGGGSNVLISDKGFNGLIVKNEARNFKIEKETARAESGAILSQLVNASVKAGLSGLVEGAGIPGTVGGAVWGNAGWPKGAWAIGNVVKGVELLMPDGRIKKVSKNWFAFDYRTSRLKMIKDEKPVILEVVLKLKKGQRLNLGKRLREILKIRFKKIPAGFSAGSVFKNPPGGAAGELIEGCGLKGKRFGRAEISKKHANFIVNLGGARASDVLNLMKLAKAKVKRKFGITLEEEIQILR